MHVVDAVYPHSNLSCTVSYETYVAGQEESACVVTQCLMTELLYFLSKQ